MGRNSPNAGELLLGLLVGGVLVGASAAFLASKRGRALRRDIVGKVQEYGDKFGEVVESVTERAHDAEDWGRKATKKAKKAVSGVLDEVEEMSNRNFVDLKIGLIVGSILGGVLGIGVNKMWSSRDEDHDYSVLENLGNYMTDLKEIVGNISGAIGETGAKATKVASKGKHSLQDVVDFATAGISLWQNMRARSERE